MSEDTLQFYQGSARIHPHAFGYRACGIVPDPGIPSYAAHRRWAKDKLAPVPAYPYRNTGEEWTHTGNTMHMDGKFWYFGIMDQHFGHFITESLTRIWWHLSHPGHGRRPVIVQHGIAKNWDGRKTKILALKKWQQEIFSYFGIENPLYVYTPMSFDDIVIPEQGALLFSDYHTSQYQETLAKFDVEKNGVRNVTKKIFIRRPEMNPPAGILGEAAFEKMLLKAGYSVVRPEEISFEEQILAVRNASHVIAAEGSALHLWNVLGQSSKTNILAFQRLGGFTNESFTKTITPYVNKYILNKPALRISTDGGSNKNLVLPDINHFKELIKNFDHNINYNGINFEEIYNSMISDLSKFNREEIILNLK